MKIQSKDTGVVYILLRKKVLGQKNLWAFTSEDESEKVLINWNRDSDKYSMIEA